MLSTKESVARGSSRSVVAVYKGLKVAVYIAEKTELSLSHSDLIELINVCSLFYFVRFIQSFIVIIIHVLICICIVRSISPITFSKSLLCSVVDLFTCCYLPLTMEEVHVFARVCLSVC